MKNTKVFPSIVIPVFNEAENLPTLHRSLKSVIGSFERHEIVFVDDGSTDDSLAVVKQLASADCFVRFISFTRNFGHQVALRTGLEASKGNVVISMDADMQHPPEVIPEMIDRWADGYHVVNMIRCESKSSYFKSWSSRLFYRLVNTISDRPISPGSSDFRLLDRKVVDVVCSLPEKCIFLRGLIPWLGYEQYDLEFSVNRRLGGREKYGMLKMISLALIGVTSSSIRPLRISFFIGAVAATGAVLYAVYALVIKLAVGTAISGWTSLLISVLLLGGVQLMMLGIVGEYLGRVFLEVKDRPMAIVKASSPD